MKVPCSRYVPAGEVLSFNYVLTEKELGRKWLHFFVADRCFERVWHGFERYVPILKKAAGVITPDFSMWRDAPLDEQREAWLKNRLLAMRIAELGVPFVPTATFGGPESWEWCFDGLSVGSHVAITVNGTKRDPEARRLFVGGLDALMRRIAPPLLVVCGKPPDWIEEKYAGVRVVRIESFGEQWHRRAK